MNLPYILLLFILPVFLSGAISLMLRNNQVKLDINKRYFAVKIINGIALIVSIYNLVFTSFWIRIHHETLSFYEITTLTKMITLFYYIILPIDLFILAFILYGPMQKYLSKNSATAGKVF